jgi:DNA polymerase-3 subunit delta'
MALSDIAGHERQLALLKGGIRRDAIGPAYLFFGPPGVGKRTVSMEFAKALLCLSEGGDACDVCDSCRRSPEIHPDLTYVTLEKDKKILRKDQIDVMQHFLSLTPSRGSRKVAILEPAESMNLSAANAMLKTLEEPPPGTVIILVAANPGGLPPTVVSRCQKVSFGLLGEGQVREVLRREGWDEDEAAAAAAVSEGSPGLAMSLRSEAWKRALRGLEALCAAPDAGAVLEYVDAKLKDRTEAEFILHILLGKARGEMRARLGLEAGRGLSGESGPGGLDDDELQRLSAGLVETVRLLGGNVNMKLALGSFFSDWAGRLTGGPRVSG